jgi:hypothetical protein
MHLGDSSLDFSFSFLLSSFLLSSFFFSVSVATTASAATARSLAAIRLKLRLSAAMMA